MKKFIILSTVVLVSACAIRAGDINFWPERNQWIEDLQTLPITFYDTSMQVAKTELVTQRNYPTNKVLSARVGYSVVDDKTSRKIQYAKEMVRANQDGGLTSIAAPVLYKKAQQVDLLGEVILPECNERYALIPTEEKDFVALIDNKGHLYNKIGQIRNDRLALLKTNFIVYPETFSFTPTTETKMEMTSPIKGYDIKYGGIKGDYLTFIYYRFDAPNNNGVQDSGEFEVLSYPKDKRLIDLYGVKIKIINIFKDSIEYMILAK